MAAAWGSPLIVDNHIYIGDEDGDICVFNLTAEKHDPVSEINMGNAVYTTPIVANGVLYIATRTHLFAIQATQQDRVELKALAKKKVKARVWRRVRILQLAMQPWPWPAARAMGHGPWPGPGPWPWPWP